MTVQLKVSTIACESCLETITKAIKKELPEAQILGNLSTKVLTIDTQASEGTLKATITGVGRTVA